MLVTKSTLATCQEDSVSTTAGCYFNLLSCPGPDSVSCNGDVAKVCSGKQLIQYDCGSVGMKCATSAGTEYCVAPTCKPVNVDNCTESCDADGITLNLCYGGVPYAVDCTNYGLSSCVADTKSSDGLPFAACQ